MRKFAVMILVAFGVVSVSMGAYIPEKDEANYQKLKAEVEEVRKALKNYQNDAYCEFEERPRDKMCRAMNVVAFFDEIRARQVKADCGKKKFCSKEDREYGIAMKEVREIPRFKNDSGIYPYVRENRGSMGEMAYFKDKVFWESVWQEWKMTKRKVGVGLAKQGVFDEWKDGK